LDVGSFSAANNPIRDLLMMRYMPNRFFPFQFQDEAQPNNVTPMLLLHHTYMGWFTLDPDIGLSAGGPLTVVGAGLNFFTLLAGQGHPEGAGSYITFSFSLGRDCHVYLQQSASGPDTILGNLLRAVGVSRLFWSRQAELVRQWVRENGGLA
jgi:hypothetical protein